MAPWLSAVSCFFPETSEVGPAGQVGPQKIVLKLRFFSDVYKFRVRVFGRDFHEVLFNHLVSKKPLKLDEFEKRCLKVGAKGHEGLSCRSADHVAVVAVHLLYIYM